MSLASLAGKAGVWGWLEYGMRAGAACFAPYSASTVRIVGQDIVAFVWTWLDKPDQKTKPLEQTLIEESTKK